MMMVGRSVFLSSGDGYVGELLELPQGCQRPFRGSRGKVGFLSRHCSRKWPHLTLRGECPAFLELWQETWGPSRVTAGTSGTRSCCLRKVQFPASCEGPLWIPLQSIPGPRSSSGFRTEPQVFSPVLTWTSGFLFNADMDLGVPMEFQQRSRASSLVETCKSAFLSICNSKVRVPVQLT